MALRIPLALAKQINVQEGDPVTLKISAAGLTVKPVPKRLNLDDLLSKVTPEKICTRRRTGALTLAGRSFQDKEANPARAGTWDAWLAGV